MTGTGQAAAMALVALLAACGGASSTQRGSLDPDDAIVYLDTEADDAAVWVNERLLGQVRELRGGIALAPGRHRLELRQDNYHTRYLELDLRARERRRVALELAPSLP